MEDTKVSPRAVYTVQLHVKSDYCFKAEHPRASVPP